MTQAKPIFISNASSRIFLLSNFNIQYTGIVAETVTDHEIMTDHEMLLEWNGVDKIGME